MQNQLRSRSRPVRLELLDEEDKGGSPSYFEWREQTVSTKAFKPEQKPQPKANSLIRLFRRFA
ncbi:MAG TPA: hypothetical protein VIU34_22310 [Steroidobacter sp.]